MIFPLAVVLAMASERGVPRESWRSKLEALSEEIAELGEFMVDSVLVRDPTAWRDAIDQLSGASDMLEKILEEIPLGKHEEDKTLGDPMLAVSVFAKAIDLDTLVGLARSHEDRAAADRMYVSARITVIARAMARAARGDALIWPDEAVDRKRYDRRLERYLDNHADSEPRRQETAALEAAEEARLAGQARFTQGIDLVWEHEESPDLSWMDDDQKKDYRDGRLEVLHAAIRTEKGDVLASLGEIAVYQNEDGHAYREDVEVDLAREAGL
jgi:hypothetical protein